MTRTEAPNDLEGRGVLNLARTTPELPTGRKSVHIVLTERAKCSRWREHTVRAGDLAPNDADLGAADLLLALVDVGYSLAEVEAARTC